MPVKRGIEDGTDDTEGNSLKSHVTDGLEDDTEGHAGHARFVDDGVEDDTQGNGARYHPAPALDADDTEGQGQRPPTADGEDDTEGNGFRH